VAIAIATALLSACSAMDAGVAERLSHGAFQGVRIYQRPSAALHLALLLSGDGGWGGSDRCISPGADLADLAHFLQQRYALPDAPPVLIGYSAGATLAYVALAQSPAGTFAGALTLSFCADLDLAKPLCAAPPLRSLARSGGVRLQPVTAALPAAWFALHGLDDTVCPAEESREFAGATPRGHFIALPDISHSYHHISRWWPMFDAAWRQLTAPDPGVSAPRHGAPQGAHLRCDHGCAHGDATI
jgi:type IV secretory pathway VirJ component